MFRAIMPDCSSTIVVAKHGHTVREALESLFERRNLEFGLLDVVIQSNGEVELSVCDLWSSYEVCCNV